MKLIKYNNNYVDPFAELEKFFDEAFSGVSRYPLCSGVAPEGLSKSFPLDVYRDEENYYLTAELPGIKKKDIDISLNKGVLEISGEQKSKDNKDDTVTRFSRSVSLSDWIDPDKVKAHFEDGLLTVDLPLREESKPKAIKIA